MKKKKVLTSVYILSLNKNKRIKDHYHKQRIKGCRFLEISNKKDLGKIKNAEIIFIISSKDISNDFKKSLRMVGDSFNTKITIAPRKYKNLNEISTSYISTKQYPKEIHWFLKQVIESITNPSLIGVSHIDVYPLFLMSTNIKFRRYKGKLDKKDQIINKIKKEFKRIDSCFFVFNGTKRMKLGDAIYFQERLSSFSKHCVYGARVNKKASNDFEIFLLAGSRK